MVAPDVLLRTIMVALLVVAPLRLKKRRPNWRAREAVLKVPADQASLRIVVRAEADTVAEAMRSAGTRINKITDFLDSLDIEPGKERAGGIPSNRFGPSVLATRPKTGSPPCWVTAWNIAF